MAKKNAWIRKVGLKDWGSRFQSLMGVLTWNRWWVMLVIVGVLFLVLMGMLGLSYCDGMKQDKKRSLDGEDVGQKSSPPRENLNAYHLYTNDKLYKKKNMEYMIIPEKIGLQNDDEVLVNMLKKHKIFNNDDELIQVELNQLSP